MQPEPSILNFPSEPRVVGSDLAAAEGKRVKVLLIEDNPGDARLIEIMLASEAGTLFEIQEFAQTEEFDDDVCLVAMEVDRLATAEPPAR